MSNFFVYNDNEDGTIVFEDYKVLHFEEVDEYDEHEILYDDELEYLLPVPPDIYSNDHPWDNIPNIRYRNRPDIWMLNINI